jgi:hypothetical protein
VRWNDELPSSANLPAREVPLDANAVHRMQGMKANPLAAYTLLLVLNPAPQHGY